MYQCEDYGTTFLSCIDWGLPCPNWGGKVHWIGNIEHDDKEKDE